MPACASFVGAAVTFVPLNGRIFVFGGANQDGYSGETYIYNGVTWLRMMSLHRPAGRTGAVFAYHAASGDLVIFGGKAGPAFFNDTYVYTQID